MHSRIESIAEVNYYEAKLRGELLEYVLNKIPQREAFVLREHVLKDRTQTQIARKMGVSTVRVHQLKQQAMKRLCEYCRNDTQIFRD